MPYYKVTATTRSTLHPRAAARLGFSTLVPGAVHELDADVAAPFLAHTTKVPAGTKTDTATGEPREVTRKVEHPGLLEKTTKKKAEAALAELAELAGGDESDEAGDEAGDE